MLPVVDAGKAMLERLVLWSAEQDWIVSKTLVFVTPGVGLDAKAIELADSIGFDVGTMKVRLYPTPTFSLSLLLACLLAVTVLLPLLSCCLRCSVGTTAGGRGAWGPRVCLLCWLHFLAGHFYQGWLDILVYLSHIIGAVVALHDDEYALPPALHCPPCDLFVAARGGIL